MEFITYEMFGAVGNGTADDMPAIKAAHDEANAKGLPVRAREGAVYRISPRALKAIIMTDTDWTGASFVIDDVDCENRNLPIFSVPNTEESVGLKIDSIKEGETHIDNPFGCDLFVKVENSEHRDYIRKGPNQNSGTSRRDIFIVRADGSLTSPVGFEFEKITAVNACRIPEKKLTINGGTFTTVANQWESKYDYHARNICIARSNTEVCGITHYVTGELDHGAPYGGFLTVTDCAEIYVHDCIFTGHKTYYTIGSAGVKVGMGSYDISLGSAANVTFRNCSQTNDINDSSRWGVFGSNYCRDMLLENCDFSRFDAHQGVHNCTIRRCRLGFSGINAIGFGTFTIEDCENRCGSFIGLRSDYGSTFKGKFIIRRCTWYPRSERRVIFGASNDGTHDFGYTCYLPQEIYIDGFTVVEGEHTSDEPLYIFGNYAGNSEAPLENRPYMPIPPKSVKVRGVKTDRKIVLCEDMKLMPDTEFDAK